MAFVTGRDRLMRLQQLDQVCPVPGSKVPVSTGPVTVDRSVGVPWVAPIGVTVAPFGSPITRISAIKDLHEPISALPGLCGVVSRCDVQGRLVRLRLIRNGQTRFMFAH